MSRRKELISEDSLDRSYIFLLLLTVEVIITCQIRAAATPQ